MSTKPSRLEIRLLGPVEVVVDGTPLAVDTKKAVALLAYLGATGQEQSRDHLADLLWPDSDPDRARATLRRTLSALRSGLGDRWIEADRSSIRFRQGADTWVDVDVLMAAAAAAHGHGSDQVCPLCVESLGSAAHLVRGEFMEGFAVRGCPAFDDWMMGEAEHLRRRISSILERLSTALVSEGRYSEAIEAGARWLEVDPLLEKAHRTMMLLHAWSGDRSGAVDAYRACVAVLDRELGVEPLEETTELYEAILEEDLPRAPAPVRRLEPVEPARAVGYPLVGRRGALARLRAAMSSGRGLVIIEGELGIGKTRLIGALAAEAESSRTPLFIGAAYRSDAGVAYGPIQQVLSAALESPEARSLVNELPPAVLAETARLIPSLGTPPPIDPSDGAARTRFMDALAQTIAALGESVTLVIDNLHWLDAASLDLIAYMARRTERLGLVLILTRRPEDTPLDHPVSVLVEDLSGEADVIRLERLDRGAVAELVRVAGVEGVDADHLFERTRGLPFFVIEYLDSARAGLTDIPLAVRRLVLARLNELDSVGRQVLTATAVIGTSADVEAILDVSGRSEDEILTGLDELIRRSMLREVGDGGVEFVHEQMREVAYEDTSLNRRRLLHRRAAEHFSSRPGAAADHRRMAVAAAHHRMAGNDGAAAELSAVAAELAVGVFAFEDAIGHLENALALGHPDRGALLTRVGALRTLTGQYGAAIAAYETARSILDPAVLPGDSAVIANAIGEVYRRLRRWEPASASFAEALANTEDPALRSRAAANWAFVEYRRGDVEAARSLATEALQSAEACDDPDAEALAHNLAGLLSSEDDDRAAHYDRALSLSVLPSVRAAVLNNLALSLAAAGDVPSAIDRAKEALDQAVRSGDRHRIAALHDTLADMFHAGGDEEAAMGELKQAVAMFAEVGEDPGSYEPEVWLLKEW